MTVRLCLFHALLLERRQYKGLGWRQPYEFSAADFLSAIKQVGETGGGFLIRSLRHINGRNGISDLSR